MLHNSDTLNPLTYFCSNFTNRRARAINLDMDYGYKLFASDPLRVASARILTLGLQGACRKPVKEATYQTILTKIYLTKVQQLAIGNSVNLNLMKTIVKLLGKHGKQLRLHRLQIKWVCYAQHFDQINDLLSALHHAPLTELDLDLEFEMGEAWSELAINLGPTRRLKTLSLPHPLIVKDRDIAAPNLATLDIREAHIPHRKFDARSVSFPMQTKLTTFTWTGHHGYEALCAIPPPILKNLTCTNVHIRGDKWDVAIMAISAHVTSSFDNFIVPFEFMENLTALVFEMEWMGGFDTAELVRFVGRLTCKKNLRKFGVSLDEWDAEEICRALEMLPKLEDVTLRVGDRVHQDEITKVETELGRRGVKQVHIDAMEVQSDTYSEVTDHELDEISEFFSDDSDEDDDQSWVTTDPDWVTTDGDSDDSGDDDVHNNDGNEIQELNETYSDDVGSEAVTGNQEVHGGQGAVGTGSEVGDGGTGVEGTRLGSGDTNDDHDTEGEYGRGRQEDVMESDLEGGKESPGENVLEGTADETGSKIGGEALDGKGPELGGEDEGNAALTYLGNESYDADVVCEGEGCDGEEAD
ncbi:hypothetical protein HDV00_007845 [Rhizophlyctis rosea]|nr:hypothetical protein HDV00_007845 [Rhizophlyctis rosea]